MTTFEINGNVIIAKKFDFNLVCDLDDMGVSIQEAGKKPMAMVRAYLALCLNAPLSVAGEELEKHIVNGGSFDDIMGAMSKEMEESDFFRNLNEQTTPKKTTKAQTSKK